MWHLWPGWPIDFDLRNLRAPAGGDSLDEFGSFYVACGKEMGEGYGGYTSTKSEWLSIADPSQFQSIAVSNIAHGSAQRIKFLRKLNI